MQDGRHAAASFTLIEVIMVLAVLSLGLVLLVLRGPPRSAALEIRAAAGEMAQALRLARAQSIARNVPVRVVVNPARSAWRTGRRRARCRPASSWRCWRCKPRVAEAKGGQDAFAAERARVGDVLQAIAAITDSLPDDTWLTEFTPRQRTLGMAGRSAGAARLIGLLPADPTIRGTRDAAFAAPLPAPSRVASMRFPSAPNCRCRWPPSTSRPDAAASCWRSA